MNTTTQVSVRQLNRLLAVYPADSMNFIDRLAQVKAELESLPALEAPLRPTPSRRQMVDYLFWEIESLLLKNYTYERIAQCLKDRLDVGISSGTLRKYHGENRQAQKISPSGSGQRKVRSTGSQKSRRPESIQLNQDPPSTSPGPSTPKVERTRSSKAAHSAAETVVATASTPVEPISQPRESASKKAPVTSPVDTPTEAEEKGTEDWKDDNPPAGGLLNELTFNTIQRR